MGIRFWKHFGPAPCPQSLCHGLLQLPAAALLNRLVAVYSCMQAANAVDTQAALLCSLGWCQLQHQHAHCACSFWYCRCWSIVDAHALLAEHLRLGVVHAECCSPPWNEILLLQPNGLAVSSAPTCLWCDWPDSPGSSGHHVGHTIANATLLVWKVTFFALDSHVTINHPNNCQQHSWACTQVTAISGKPYMGPHYEIL